MSTEEQGDDGLPSGIKSISKSDLRELASKVLKKEKSLSDEEAENYLKQNFNHLWKEHDSSSDQSKLVQQEEALEIINKLL